MAKTTKHGEVVVEVIDCGDRFEVTADKLNLVDGHWEELFLTECDTKDQAYRLATELERRY
ncbi:hypothetical protein [Geomicrobium sp. JCM 19055]|uniref:hypothetical protein n=1 Tax=Geomicrobium sp. JCM 19055 TaxID=1460649 RepID=UPI00045ED0D1|nr:hypothetical protein [Geomicrobium sp. JCM 19055]GAK00862.1 hypothetical protein JCM19055_3980 [Geomicrobium sp. JCM 19055]